MIKEAHLREGHPMIDSKWGLFFSILLLPFIFARAEGGQGFRFGMNTLRYSHSTAYSGVSPGEISATHLDVNIGYVQSTGFYVGGAYTSFNDYNLNSTTGVSTETRSGIGLVLGYYFDTYYVDWTLVLSSQLDRATGYKFTGGLGSIFKAGYNVMFGSSFYLGVGVVFNNFNWTESTDPAGVKSLVNNMQSDFYPSLNIGFVY
jgi:hypothetical protein